MRRSILSAAIAIAALTASPAQAKNAPSKTAIGVTSGTLGIGPEASVVLGRDVAARGNLTFFTVGRHFYWDDTVNTARISLASAGLMADYHVGGSGFVVSAGARINGNRLRASVTPVNDIDVGDNTYTPEQVGTLRTAATFAPIAPTLTMGYAGHLTKGLKVGVEAGAMLMGSARVRPFTVSGTGVAAADLEFERRDLEDDLRRFHVHPILQLSLAYHR